MPLSCRRLSDVLAMSPTGSLFRIERYRFRERPPHDCIDQERAETILTRCRLANGDPVTWVRGSTYRLKCGAIIKAIRVPLAVMD